jgi:hypothetical protein
LNIVPNELIDTQIAKKANVFSSINKPRKLKQQHKSNKINFTSEISPRIEQIENQKINDNEIHE